MSDTAVKEQRKTSSKALDIFVVLFCLSGAAVSLYLFYQDLYAAFRSLNAAPAGTVTEKYNNVQRLPSGRKVWDRLFKNSPVYSGDLIRIAQLSGATLNTDEETPIVLGENTIIRIQKDADIIQIGLFEGNINVSSGKDSGAILLSIGNQTVQVLPGAEVNALSGNDGLVLRVTDGAAQIIRNGQIRDVPAGGIIIQDTDGNEVRQPMAAVIHPKPNALFLKTEPSPLNVEFRWSRINMRSGDIIRLEIAEDKNFRRITRTVDNLDSSASVYVNAGVWHWRLLHEDTQLSSGRMSVTEASAPTLLAPAAGGPAEIPVRFAGQEVQFRWAEIPEAAYYNLQVSTLPDFIAPEINLQLQMTNYINSDLDAGTWYWRVQPVFSNAYEGTARFSQVSSFKVQPAIAANASTETAQGYIAVEEDHPEEAFIALLEQTRQIQQEQQTRTIQPEIAPQVQQTASASQPQQQRQGSQPQQQPLRLVLLYPEQNVVIPGLTALRQPTIFRWDTDEDIEFSRFVLSRRANPTAGRPDIDIQNPGRTISVSKLAEGVWYWTVEGRSRDGRPITAAAPRQIRIQPIPLLPAPRNRTPEAGFTIGADELRNKETIVFSWARVEGANSYILSIFKDGFPRRQRILQTEPLRGLTYTFNNYSLFDDSGTFYWQVEAVSYNVDGIFEQRGTPGENKFILDIPRPGRVKTKKTGDLYGR